MLFSAPIRDTLLRAAGEDLYMVHWTDDILREVVHSLVKSGRVSEERAQSLVAAMSAAFPEASVDHYKHLIASMKNDPKDRHVLAAAVASASQVIVTNNLRDFPREALDLHGIEAQPVDEFLTNLFDLAPDDMTQIIVDQAGDLHKPAMTIGELLEIIAKQAPRFAECVRAQITISDSSVRRLKVNVHQKVRVYSRPRFRK